MPITLNQNINENTNLIIWHITEQLADLEIISKDCLQTSDFEEFNNINNIRRKKEWLIVRILVFKLLGKYSKIYYDKNKKPFLANNQTISISHSQNYVGILLTNSKFAGLDIEQISEKIENVINKFLSTDEIKNIHPKDKYLTYTILWAAKETLYKLYGKKELIFKSNLHVESFIPQNQDIIHGFININEKTEKYNLNYFILNDNIVVWCIK